MYKGEYINNLRNGYGIMIIGDKWLLDKGKLKKSIIYKGVKPQSPHPYKYEGYWKDGQMDGIGTMFFKDGSSKYGLWEEGIFVKSLNKFDISMSDI